MYTKFIDVEVSSSKSAKECFRKDVEYILKTLDGKKNTNWEEGNKLVGYPFISRRLGHMMGEILTVIDASIFEQRQNKAIKDIIRGIFVDEYVELTNMLYDKKELEESRSNAPEGLIEEVSTDEALGIK